MVLSWMGRQRDIGFIRTLGQLFDQYLNPIGEPFQISPNRTQYRPFGISKIADQKFVVVIIGTPEGSRWDRESYGNIFYQQPLAHTLHNFSLEVP